jgi:topoisomerase IA-like protein
MITKDGYATVPWGDRFILIHNGFQLSDHATDAEAIEALKEHREQSKQKPTKRASKKTATPAKTTKKPRGKLK